MVAPLLSGLVVLNLSFFGVLTWAAPTLTRNLSLPPAQAGGIMATVLMISGLLGPVAGGVTADLCQRAGKPRRTMWILSGLALLGIPGSLFAIATGVTQASVLMVAFMVAMSATMAMGMTLFLVVIPNEMRGLCLSFLTVANGIVGAGLAPLVVSLLSGEMGGGATLGHALVLTCICAHLVAATAFACRQPIFSSCDGGSGAMTGAERGREYLFRG